MLITQKIEYANLKNIDLTDEMYLFTYPQVVDEKLKQSIQSMGILNPVVLEQKEDGNYRIISGIKRIKIAIELGLENIPAYLFPPSENKLQNFLFSVEENASFRAFNELEKAAIISKLFFKLSLIGAERRGNLDKGLNCRNSLEMTNSKETILQTQSFKSEDKILIRVCSILNIAFSEHNIQKYLSIVALTDELKIEVFESKLSWDAAVNLMRFTDRNRKDILRIIKDLRLNLNISREIVEILKDLVRSGKNIDRILAEILEFMQQDVDIKDKVVFVRGRLAKERYPNLSAKQAKFNETKKKIEINGKVAVNYFPFFEREEYSLTVNFKDIDELKDLKGILRKIDERLG